MVIYSFGHISRLFIDFDRVLEWRYEHMRVNQQIQGTASGTRGSQFDDRGCIVEVITFTL